MNKRKKIKAELKRSGGKSPIPNAKQFTSEYQPSSEARSKGQKKYWEYRKSRQLMFEKLCDITLPSGKTVDFWDKIRDKLHYMIFDKKSKLDDKEKSDLMLKLCKEFMPEMKQLEIDSKRPIHIHIGEDDASL